MAKMYPKVFLRDSLVSSGDANLSIASSAVLYGLSVYTVFPVCIGKKGGKFIFRLDEHFRRLINSARIIGIDTFEQQWDIKRFQKAVNQLIAANDIKTDIFVRATVHVTAEIAGTRSRGLESSLSMFIYDASTILPKDGGRLKTSVWRRIPDFSIPSRAKVNGAYVNSVLAKQDALDSGYDDCVFLDTHGHVCELSAANIFLVRNGVLVTPDTNNDLLEGINRRSVLEIAEHDLGLKVVERQVDLTELYIADEIFASGTSANIASIHEIDGRRVGGGKTGPITAQIQKIHYDLLHGDYPDREHWLSKA